MDTGTSVERVEGGDHLTWGFPNGFPSDERLDNVAPAGRKNQGRVDVVDGLLCRMADRYDGDIGLLSYLK